MSPVYISILGAIVRALLGPAVIWANAHGITITDDQVAQVALDATAILVAIIWAVWRQVKTHRILNTALGSDTVMTPAEAKRQVEDGVFASARTPANVVPQVQDNSRL